ncbi:MAG: acetylglutamate kinase [Acidimicrobiales bacterium]|nr:acetylglutamate kinase [Acidimicrobiales bacterium]
MTGVADPSRITDPAQIAGVLVEALPYITRLSGQIVVVKYGGNAMVEESLARQFAEDVVLLQRVGAKPVIVHGGGPQIGDLLARLGKESVFHDGLRVTDAETLEVARMVLEGKINSEIVAGINVHGPLAVGLSGGDASLIQASARNPALGFVGDVAAVNPTIVERLLAEDLIPVISTIGTDAGGQAYNINADTGAGAVAEALGAHKVIYLTDVEGLRLDADDPSTLVSEITTADLQRLVDDGVMSGGMIPKIAACIHAVEHGVGSAHILDGRVPHVVLLELFTDAGIGTMVTGPQAGATTGDTP